MFGGRSRYYTSLWQVSRHICHVTLQVFASTRPKGPKLRLWLNFELSSTWCWPPPRNQGPCNSFKVSLTTAILDWHFPFKSIGASCSYKNFILSIYNCGEIKPSFQLSPLRWLFKSTAVMQTYRQKWQIDDGRGDLIRFMEKVIYLVSSISFQTFLYRRLKLS